MPQMRDARIGGLALLFAVAGCAATTPGQPPAPASGTRVSESMLTCSEATRAARQALMRLGYSITRVTPAKAGAPGTVVATRDTGWSPASPEPGTVHTATVTITCSDSGAEFIAGTDEGFIERMSFPQRFTAAVQAAVGRKTAQPKATNEEPRGLLVSVEPQRGTAAQHEFGADLPAAGITPVKIEIKNRSDRRYDFKSSDVELLTEEGSHVEPLSLADAVACLGSSPDAAAARQRMSQKELQDRDIPPGLSLDGYLYFKAAAYRRARVVLTDVESDEAEGFSVEF
jgi:hypothetical protein